jgi:hypothetical protein
MSDMAGSKLMPSLGTQVTMQQGTLTAGEGSVLLTSSLT